MSELVHALAVAVSMLATLNCLQGVCHRDLKLENTLLDGSPAPRVKICDFGYSKSVLDSQPKSTVGTPAYIAPEVGAALPPSSCPSRDKLNPIGSWFSTTGSTVSNSLFSQCTMLGSKQWCLPHRQHSCSCWKGAMAAMSTSWQQWGTKAA